MVVDALTVLAVAVMVYVTAADEMVGVPDITPVVVLKDSPVLVVRFGDIL